MFIQGRISLCFLYSISISQQNCPTPFSVGFAEMAFLLAGLISERDSVIDNIHHIDRGYEKIEERLGNIGFDIIRET